MKNSEIQKVPVEMTLSDWLRFADILLKIGKKMQADADEFANVVYIAAPQVAQKAQFEEKARSLMAVMRCKMIIDEARDEIRFKVKQAMYEAGIIFGCWKRYDDNIEERIKGIEKLIRNQSLAAIDLKLIVEAKIAHDCTLPDVRTIAEDDDWMPQLDTDYTPVKAGLSVKILSDEDLDALKMMVQRLRQQEYKRKCQIARFMGQNLKLDMLPEIVEYIKE